MDIYGYSVFTPNAGVGTFFFLKDTSVQWTDHAVLLMIIAGSAASLVLSFISAIRAMAIKYGEALFVHSVIEDNGNAFRRYQTEFHAKGLLYCAVMNAAINDHIAQFVRGAYTLLAIAVVGFALSITAIGWDMTRAGKVQEDAVKEKSISPAQQDNNILDSKGAERGPNKLDGRTDGFPW